MQYVKEVVAFGERPVGSANHKKLENYILAHLKGDDVDSATFTADTPEGKFPVRNITPPTGRSRASMSSATGAA